MREIGIFSFSKGEYESTGLSLFHWRDRRKLDKETGSMIFSFTRTYDNHDAETLAEGWWEFTQSPSLYPQAMLGPNVKCYLEVIQRVTPDIAIIRATEQYPNVPFPIHHLILSARLRTPTGFIEIHRTIRSPEIEAAMNDSDAVWTTNFHWVRHDIAKRNENGECIQVEASVNGSFLASTAEYAYRWMVELAISLVRIDALVQGQKLLRC